MLCAQEAALGNKKTPIGLLPTGSVLTGVLLPRYDAERNLVGTLKAQTMTLLDAERIQGNDVLIRFYNPDRSPRGKVELVNALFDQEKGRLYANEPVEVTNDRLLAKGTGLVYAFQEGGQGFLRGPASTRIFAPPATAMNAKPVSTAALALAFAPGLLLALEPPFVTEKELAAIQADAKTMKPEAAAASLATEQQLAEQLGANSSLVNTALEFVKTSEMPPTKEPAVEIPAPSAPLAIEPGPDDTIINCEDGMYFDSDKGRLVYFGNVKLEDPGFTLTGANELTIFFEQKPSDSQAPKEKAAGLGGGNFGEAEKMVATGAVHILQKSVDGKAPVEASGRVLTYYVKTGEIIISDGFPWVKQGDFFARAKQPDLTLRMLNDGTFATRGNWEMGGKLGPKDGAAE